MSKLRLQNVRKAFGGVLAVEGLSFEFAEGKVSALIGPNGAGKTTIFNLISGLLHPSEGEIYYGDKKISRLAPWDIAQLGVGRLFQDVRVFDRLTAMENVLVAFRKQAGESALRAVVRRSQVDQQEKSLRQRAARLLRFVGLGYEAGELAFNLSYGQQKLLSLARLLAADMDVLLLDEPTAGISQQAVQKILELIRKLADEGKTIVMIEHNLNVVSENVDQVIFVDDGRIVSSGTPEVILHSLAVRDAYLV